MTAEPRVLVLLAAFNGVEYLADQVESILRQEGVSTKIVISVDKSSDTTESMVDELASCGAIVALPHGKIFGGAAPNFYRLMAEVEFDGFSHVALADQDDIWMPSKLRTAVDRMAASGAKCYSSNVLAWDPISDSRKLVDKAQSQRRWDHLFSSAGPGCTYVFDVDAAAAFGCWLRSNRQEAAQVEYHDWLLYAWMRQHGHSWFIDKDPSMLYRQHQENQLGANQGLGAALSRVKQVAGSWYEQQVMAVATCVGALDEWPIRILRREVRAGPGVFGTAKECRRTVRDALIVLSLLMARRRGRRE